MIDNSEALKKPEVIKMAVTFAAFETIHVEAKRQCDYLIVDEYKEKYFTGRTYCEEK